MRTMYSSSCRRIHLQAVLSSAAAEGWYMPTPSALTATLSLTSTSGTSSALTSAACSNRSRAPSTGYASPSVRNTPFTARPLPMQARIWPVSRRTWQTARMYGTSPALITGSPSTGAYTTGKTRTTPTPLHTTCRTTTSLPST